MFANRVYMASPLLGGKQPFVLLDHPFPTPPQVTDRDGLAIVTRLFPDT